MQDSYVAGVAALADALRHRPGQRARPPRVGAERARSTRPARAASAAINRHQLLGHGPSSGPPSTSGRGRCRHRADPDAAPTSPRRTPPARATYVVQPDDSWWSIAAATLGDPGRTWPVLAGGQRRPRTRVLHARRRGGVPAWPGCRRRRRSRAAIPPFPGDAQLGDPRPGRAGVAGLALIATGRDHATATANRGRRPTATGCARRVRQAPGVVGLVRRRRRGRPPHVVEAPRRPVSQRRDGSCVAREGRTEDLGHAGAWRIRPRWCRRCT